MARDPEFVFNYLKQVESLANEVLSDKRNLLEASKKRDKSREASRVLQKTPLTKNSETWVCSGNLFMSFTKSQAAAMLEKDYNKSEKEVNDLHQELKTKVSKLYDAENKSELKKFNLVPLTKEEKQNLFNLIGIE